jgi:hypothetical protein
MPTNPSIRLADIAWRAVQEDRVVDLPTVVWGLFGNRRPDGKPALTPEDLAAPIETFVLHEMISFARLVLAPAVTTPTPPPPLKTKGTTRKHK